jgi:hypothetical protein
MILLSQQKRIQNWISYVYIGFQKFDEGLKIFDTTTAPEIDDDNSAN